VTIEAYASHSTTPEGREALKQIPGLYPKALTLTGDITVRDGGAHLALDASQCHSLSLIDISLSCLVFLISRCVVAAHLETSLLAVGEH